MTIKDLLIIREKYMTLKFQLQQAREIHIDKYTEDNIELIKQIGVVETQVDVIMDKLNEMIYLRIKNEK